MGETLAIAALEGSLHWGAAVAFMDPLRHRSRYPARAVTGLAGCILLAFLLSPLGQEQWALPRRLIMGLLVAIIIWFCTRLSFWGAGYCAVLAEVSCQMVYELWMTFQMWVFHGSTLPWRQYWWVEFLFTAALYLLLRFTAARWLPYEGVYDPNGLQCISGGLMALVFATLFELLRQGLGARTWDDQIVLPALLGQIYCITVLYLQTELFKKQAIQRELNTLNLLLDQQKKQYANARRSVQLINRRCHALKLENAALRKAGNLPDAELEAAIENYNAIIHTGNEVLNTVLTEKSLLCEERNIRLTCVADGTALDFLEATDLYGLFSIAMDNAIETVSSFADSDRRLVEVLVCRRQDFAVINISNPACVDQTAGEGLRHTRWTAAQDVGLKGMRRIVRKYDGMLDLDTRDGMFTLRAVFPREEQRS